MSSRSREKMLLPWDSSSSFVCYSRTFSGHLKHFLPQVLLACDPGGTQDSSLPSVCLHHIVPVAAKPSWSCCWVVSLPHNSHLCLLKTFLLVTGQKTHILCHLVGQPMVKVWKTLSNHHLNFWEGLQGPSLSGSCWKQHRVGVGFSCRGVGCRMWLLLGWPG